MTWRWIASAYKINYRLSDELPRLELPALPHWYISCTAVHLYRPTSGILHANVKRWFGLLFVCTQKKKFLRLSIPCVFLINYVFNTSTKCTFTIKYVYYHLFFYMFWRLLRHLQGELFVCCNYYYSFDHTKKVLSEDGTISAETCRRKGDNTCILLYMCNLLVYYLLHGAESFLRS
jgi:hypothetical protein